ncbi:MAG: hypothetical protein NVV63_02350 [Opitutus sp.]|nr:hypothetical protein [Opitutus sp.]
MNDLDRLVLVARCGEVIDLWQVAIAQDAAAGVMVSDFAERLRSSERWAEFRERKKMQDDLMRALMDAPPRFRTQYEKVLKQYGLLSRLLALLEKPTGSLVSYTAEVRAIASEYDQLKAELDVSLPVIELSPVFDRPKA